MSFTLIIIKQSAYQGRRSHETLEAIMSLGLFDVEHRVVFFEAGLSWVLAHQNPKGHKSLEKQLSAMPLYGCDQLYYCQEHAQQLMPNQLLNENISPVALSELSVWFHQANHVEVF